MQAISNVQNCKATAKMVVSEEFCLHITGLAQGQPSWWLEESLVCFLDTAAICWDKHFEICLSDILLAGFLSTVHNRDTILDNFWGQVRFFFEYCKIKSFWVILVLWTLPTGQRLQFQPDAEPNVTGGARTILSIRPTSILSQWFLSKHRS